VLRALIGAVAGDVVSVACPRGELRFEVVGVETSAPSRTEAA
jgi:transcription elongation GreA/GreB family factor